MLLAICIMINNFPGINNASNWKSWLATAIEHICGNYQQIALGLSLFLPIKRRKGLKQGFLVSLSLPSQSTVLIWRLRDLQITNSSAIWRFQVYIKWCKVSVMKSAIETKLWILDICIQQVLQSCFEFRRILPNPFIRTKLAALLMYP